MDRKKIIYELIPKNRFITRKELVDKLNISDRLLRRYIAEIRKDHNIISLSSGKGYKRVKSVNEMTKEEIEEMYKTIKHQIAENNSRIKKLKYNLKEQIAYLKILEKNL